MPRSKVRPSLTVIGGSYAQRHDVPWQRGNFRIRRVFFGNSVNAPGSLDGNGTVVFSGHEHERQFPGQRLERRRNTDIHHRPGHHDPRTIRLAEANQRHAGNVDRLAGDRQCRRRPAARSNWERRPGDQSRLDSSRSMAERSRGVSLVNNPGQVDSRCNGSTLSLSGNWSNAGTITATNSTLNLAGNFTRATLGNFVRTGGTVNLTGTLSGGLNLDAANGSWTLRRGTISGGSVNTSGGSQLILSIFGGTLAGVTINGNCRCHPTIGPGHFHGRAGPQRHDHRWARATIRRA